MIIVFEGLHGCGKTTQLKKVEGWIKENLKVCCTTTSWNSYPRLFEVGDELKNKDLLSPLTSSLLYALDFNLRYEQIIEPVVEKGGIVLCDRYIYTAYVRDRIRNISSTLLDEMYGHIPKPDIVFFFKTDPETSLGRLRDKLGSRTNYVLGMDLKLSNDKTENFKKFLYMQSEAYREIIKRNKELFYIIDASETVQQQFDKILYIVKACLRHKRYLGTI